MEALMSSIRVVRRNGSAVLRAAWLLACLAAPAAAQSADPNPGAITISGATDFANAYMFRGIRQEDENLIVQPYFDLGIAVHSGDGLLKSIGVNIGTWNSLHRGLSGSSGFTRELWYESDFYATLGAGFGGGVTVGATYTAYTSPNSMFSTIKEVAVKVTADGKGIKPYALIAFELDATLGFGQADAGTKAGKYVELGATPGRTFGKIGLAVPIKIGLSAGDYYELATSVAGQPVYVDNKFGYFSVGGVATVPLGGTTRFGSWNVHGGVEFQKLGDSTTSFNLGEDTKTIVLGGIGFTY
jgi:uncharacterized protein (TIGR02001 family)